MKNKDMSGSQIINGFQVSTVTFIGNGFGFAKCFHDVARFESETGYKIVAGKSQFPEFGTDYADAPKEGEAIIVFATMVRGGWLATAWGSYAEYKAAQGIIEARKAILARQPKPAPALPMPVMEVATSVSLGNSLKEEERPKNQTGQDRRKIFKPTPRSAEITSVTAPVSPDEASCLRAVAKLESLPPAETTVECSTIPSATPATKTTDQVAKQ